MLSRLIRPPLYRQQIVVLAAFLAIWSSVTGQAIAVPTPPWTVLDENGVRVVRGETTDGWVTNITVNGSPYAVLHTTLGSQQHSLSVAVDFHNGTRVEYPGHYPITTQAPYVNLVTPSGTQQVALGNSAIISSTARLSIYGFVSMDLNGRRIVVFATGILVASGSSSSVVVFPSGQNSGMSTLQVPTQMQTLLQSLNSAFAAIPAMGGSIPSISVTNYAPSSLVPLVPPQQAEDAETDQINISSGEDDASDFEASGPVIECGDLPRCCCEGTDLTPEGTCRKATIFVGGAGKGQGRADSAVGVAMAAMKDEPCHQNTFEFQYDTGETPQNNGRQLALFSNRVAQACGIDSTVKVEGMCNGGHVLWHALNYLDTEWFNFEVDFWNTPFSGGSTVVAGISNGLSFGLINLILDRAQFNIMYSTSAAGPTTLPVGLAGARIHIGDEDFFLSEESQRGPLNVRPEDVKHYDTGHFDTLRTKHEPETCCGDGRVNGDEQCEGTSTECKTTKPDGTAAKGLCSSDCQCKLPGCGNGIKEDGEECDDPLGVAACRTVSWSDPSTAYGHTAESFCTTDCKCPPLVFPSPAPAAADIVELGEPTSHSSAADQTAH